MRCCAERGVDPVQRASAITLLLAFPAFAQLSEPYVVRASVSGCIHVRVDHNEQAMSIDCLSANTPVTVIDVAPYWREITFGVNKRGWIAKKFIEPTATP